jgi:hypothetical protein
MTDNDEDRDRSRRPGAEDRRWWDIGQVLGGRTIERSGDAVCGLHCEREYEKRGFLGWVSKPRSTICQWFSLKITVTVCQWFDLKTIRTVSPDLASKLVETISPDLALKPVASSFLVWASKPVPTVYWFKTQNYSDGFLAWASKSSGLWFVGCATKPMGG